MTAPARWLQNLPSPLQGHYWGFLSPSVSPPTSPLQLQPLWLQGKSPGAGEEATKDTGREEKSEALSPLSSIPYNFLRRLLGGGRLRGPSCHNTQGPSWAGSWGSCLRSLPKALAGPGRGPAQHSVSISPARARLLPAPTLRSSHAHSTLNTFLSTRREQLESRKRLSSVFSGPGRLAQERVQKHQWCSKSTCSTNEQLGRFPSAASQSPRPGCHPMSSAES